jgi:apolipoprotein N-acyltransferase
VISPGGKIIKKLDHYKHGIGVVVADVPVNKRKTIFSLYGFWPSLVASALILICVFALPTRGK